MNKPCEGAHVAENIEYDSDEDILTAACFKCGNWLEHGIGLKWNISTCPKSPLPVAGEHSPVGEPEYIGHWDESEIHFECEYCDKSISFYIGHGEEENPIEWVVMEGEPPSITFGNHL